MTDCTCTDYKMFRCADCAMCTNCNGEYYMVHDEVWSSAFKKKRGMLCIGCLESRRGKLLTKDDFTAAPLNSINLIFGSTRLVNRLTNSTPAATV